MTNIGPEGQLDPSDVPQLANPYQAIIEARIAIDEAQAKYKEKVSDLVVSLYQSPRDAVITIILSGKSVQSSNLPQELIALIEKCDDEDAEIIDSGEAYVTMYRFERGELDFSMNYDDRDNATLIISTASINHKVFGPVSEQPSWCHIPLGSEAIEFSIDTGSTPPA